METKGRALAALVVTCALVSIANVADAVCRVVTPGPESGTSVIFDPLTTVLVIQVPDQVVAYGCAEFERPIDARLHELGGSEPEEHRGARPVCPDGAPAIAYRGTITHTVLQPSIYANGGSAGLVMPIPRRADVNIGPPDLIDEANGLLQGAIRETVTFEEDGSLGYQCSDPHYSSLAPRDDLRPFGPAGTDAMGAAAATAFGCAAGDDDFYRPGLDGRGTSVVDYGEDGSVEYESIPVSDEYEVTVLSASTLEALYTWLDDNAFEYDEVDAAAFGRYVGEGRWFVAVKVISEPLGNAHLALPPLVVSWEGDDFPITHEISYDPEGGVIETDLFVLAPQKMQVAEGDGAIRYAAPFATTPWDVSLPRFGLESGWLTRIHVERNMSDALQTDTELIAARDEREVRPPTTERTTHVRIAQACCPGNAIPRGGERTFTQVWEYAPSERPDDSEYFFSAPPPPSSACPSSDWSGSSSSGSGSSRDDDEVYLCSAAGAFGTFSPLVLALALVGRRRRSRRTCA